MAAVLVVEEEEEEEEELSATSAVEPKPVLSSRALAFRTRCQWSAMTLINTLLNMTFCDPDWNFCGQTPQYRLALVVRCAPRRVSIVPLETGNAERVDRVESVRYEFGKHGHNGIEGRFESVEGSASGSYGIEGCSGLVGSKKIIFSFLCRSCIGIGNADISEKSGHNVASVG